MKILNSCGVVLFEDEATDMRSLVEAAVRQRISLRGAKLRGRDLRGAILMEGDFHEADLSYASLIGSACSETSFDNADLSYADFNGAQMAHATFTRSNITGARFTGAELQSTVWSGARGAHKVVCIGADLTRATDIPAAMVSQTRIIPAEGSIVGYKKCVEDVIVKLRVPKKAKRSHAFSRKCRAEYVDVLKVYGASQGVSGFDASVIYKEGERVFADHFDEDWERTCTGGIHFFLTRAEAEMYLL